MSNAKTVMSQAANTWVGPTYIEDVFSTYLYTGNGSTQTITNGIDLAGEGGLVWIKNRSSLDNHRLFTTDIGEDVGLVSNNTNGTSGNSGFDPYFDFTSSGFAFPAYAASLNTNGTNYASWTFRKAPRFFDCVTWVGNGQSTQTITHNLGMAPACVIIKATGVAQNWWVYHADRGTGKYLVLNTTAAEVSGSIVTGTSEDDFTVGSTTTSNGYTYVAYLFAHDPLGPSGDGSDGLIACGSYTGNGSTDGPEINLGWEPQWLLIKKTSGADQWMMLDVMRGVPTGSTDGSLYAESAAAENFGANYIDINSTGFKPGTTNGVVNGSGATYIYIAIRRGPMRQPTSGTEVFQPVATASYDPYYVGFPTDLHFGANRSGVALNFFVTDRLRGNSKYLVTSSTAAEATFSPSALFDLQDSFDQNFSAASSIQYQFARAPGFFDVVAYTGNGVAGRTVPHNLGVAPEMMWVRERQGGNWKVYTSITGAGNYLLLNSTIASTADASFYTWNNTAPTDTAFSLGIAADANQSGQTYIAYLFASLSGVSKVGTFVASSGLNVDCGFSSGARFVLVKRIDSAGNWMVVDTARGIISAADPVLDLNSTGAEYSTDIIDPYAGGFSVGPNLTGTFVYYAIA